MPIQEKGPAPYAPPKAVIEVVNAYRDKGLRTPFDLDVLTRAGIPESLAPRTLQALKLLDLVDGEGHPTPEFDKAVRAPQDEFKTLLGELIAGAYGDVFLYADPAKEGLARVRDAFRKYTPIGQQGRMVTLFLGLLEFCGLDIGAARADTKERPQRSRSSEGSARRASSPARASRTGDSGLPEPITSLLRDALPKKGEPWLPLKRDQFLKTFEALIDLYYPTTASGELSPGETAAAMEDGSTDET
jgi:hypothetical protein